MSASTYKFHRSHFKEISVWLVIFTRILFALYILINPLWGFIWTTVFDHFDSYILKHKEGMSWWEYHMLDKYLDWVSYITMLIAGFQYGVIYILVALLAFRLVGQLMFMRTRKTIYFLLFPNLYEMAFLWFVLVQKVLFYDGGGLSQSVWLFILFIVKETQEAWLHFIWPNYLKKNGYPKIMQKIGFEAKFN
jgi:hypothetical protein